jgi:hypothetical protein
MNLSEHIFIRNSESSTGVWLCCVYPCCLEPGALSCCVLASSSKMQELWCWRDCPVAEHVFSMSKVLDSTPCEHACILHMCMCTYTYKLKEKLKRELEYISYGSRTVKMPLPCIHSHGYEIKS